MALLQILITNFIRLAEKTLFSRKFLATTVASSAFLYHGDLETFSYMWMGYAGILGIEDSADKLKINGNGNS